MGDERFYTLRVIEAILGGHEVLDDRTIQSSMLYDKLRIENGITYEVSATSFSGSDVGYLGVQGIAQPQDLQQTLDIVKKVMYRLASKVTREQVSMAKNFLSDHIIQQIDTSHGAAEFLGVPALILDKVEKPSEILEKIQAVTLKDVRNLASELLVPEQTRLAVLGPFKEVDGELKRVRNGKIK
jgi:predicted Zn-dependent peptidase